MEKQIVQGEIKKKMDKNGLKIPKELKKIVEQQSEIKRYSEWMTNRIRWEHHDRGKIERDGKCEWCKMEKADIKHLITCEKGKKKRINGMDKTLNK